MGNAKRNSRRPKRHFHGNRFTKEGAAGGQEEQVELGAEAEEGVQATGSNSSEKLQDLSFDEWDTQESDSSLIDRPWWAGFGEVLCRIKYADTNEP